MLSTIVASCSLTRCNEEIKRQDTLETVKFLDSLIGIVFMVIGLGLYFSCPRAFPFTISFLSIGSVGCFLAIQELVKLCLQSDISSAQVRSTVIPFQGEVHHV